MPEIRIKTKPRTKPTANAWPLLIGASAALGVLLFVLIRLILFALSLATDADL